MLVVLLRGEHGAEGGAIGVAIGGDLVPRGRSGGGGGRYGWRLHRGQPVQWADDNGGGRGNMLGMLLADDDPVNELGGFVRRHGLQEARPIAAGGLRVECFVHGEIQGGENSAHLTDVEIG